MEIFQNRAYANFVLVAFVKLDVKEACILKPLKKLVKIGLNT